MSITDSQFLTHANLNNREFANRQVTIRGIGDPRVIPGIVGVLGWYYLDDSVSPPDRYEKKGAGNTDWEPVAAGSLPEHNHDTLYYTQAQIDAIIAGVVGGSRILGEYPVEIPDNLIEIFTLPNGDEYLIGSLEVYVNGLYEGAPVRISSSQFQLGSPPLEVGDIIRCSYIKTN